MAMFDRDMRYLAAERALADGLVSIATSSASRTTISCPKSATSGKTFHARALAGETVRCDSDRFERPDGELVWLRWEVRPWRHPHDGIGGVLIFCEDVTERIAIRRALEDNERRLNAILDSALEAIVTIGKDGRIVSANPAACDVFGYVHAELLGTPWMC